MKLFKLIEEALQIAFIILSLSIFRHLVYNDRLITIFNFSVSVIIFYVESIFFHCLGIISLSVLLCCMVIIHFNVAEILLLDHEITVHIPREHERDEEKRQ